MFGETTISYVKIRNRPIETTIYKWLFGVPGLIQAGDFSARFAHLEHFGKMEEVSNSFEKVPNRQ